MNYSLLENDTKRHPSLMIFLLLVSVCCLAGWNTYLTITMANDDQLKTEMQEEVVETYLKTIFNTLHKKHHHGHNITRNKRSVAGIDKVANLIDEELTDACPEVCPAGPVGPRGPVGPIGPAGPLPKHPGCVLEEGFDYRGQDIISGGEEARDQDHCTFLCTRHTKCKFWTYNTESYKCYLKTSAFGRKPLQVGVSGSRECGEPACEAPWTQLSTGCYRFMELPMNYQEAKSFCLGINSKLVEIESEEENRAISEEISKIGKPKSRFWIGLTDLAEEGDWEWESSGKNPTFTNWKAREPNNYLGKEHCVNMEWNGKSLDTDTGKWNDNNCNKRTYKAIPWNALCEK